MLGAPHSPTPLKQKTENKKPHVDSKELLPFGKCLWSEVSYWQIHQLLKEEGSNGRSQAKHHLRYVLSSNIL